MKLCHRGARNSHGMSTHLRRVPADPNLSICTTSVYAVYVPLSYSNSQLYIPIWTQTASLSTGGLKSPVGKWLKYSSKHSKGTPGLASDYQLPSIKQCSWKWPSNVWIGQINNFLLFFFSIGRNYCRVQICSLNFVIILSLRDCQGYDMSGNKTKPRMLESPGVYNHWNVHSDS